MRDRYYRVQAEDSLPDRGALVRFYRRDTQIVAQIVDDMDRMEAEPDLIFLRAALMGLREGLTAIYVHLPDDIAWQDQWGDLIDYRAPSESRRPAPVVTPAFKPKSDLFDAWDYTLNLNSMTSPSLTT